MSKSTQINLLFSGWHLQTKAIMKTWLQQGQADFNRVRLGRSVIGVRREAEFRRFRRQHALSRKLGAVSGRAARVMDRLSTLQHIKNGHEDHANA